jgi:phosphoribosylamine---glycine ligase
MPDPTAINRREPPRPAGPTTPVKILIVGSGGREHALAWRLQRSPGVTSVLCVPGNPGIGRAARLVSGSDAHPEQILALAELEDVGLTVVGPELPLSLGIVDLFRAAGRPIVGPTRAAAQLESSKAFAKAVMTRHEVPTAGFEICESPAAAERVVASGRFGYPLVIKADGLAAGKGVVIAPDRVAAEATIDAMMSDRRFGAAGDRVVIEECLSGPELSFFVLSDGERVVPLGSAQDHKRAYDNDEGPNTGGMGAFAPSPLCDAALEARILDDIVRPVVEGMQRENNPYTGFLYCGLMLTSSGPRVIEFNVRFGDPEAQVVLPLIEGDFLAALQAAASGDLARHDLTLRPERTVGVVVASGGYPDTFQTGLPITGADIHAENVIVFHAGTAMKDGQLVTAGGRVLTVVGRGPDYSTAMTRAYDGVRRIHFPRMHFRRDIGAKAST